MVDRVDIGEFLHSITTGIQRHIRIRPERFITMSGTPGRSNTFTNTVQPHIKNWTSPLTSDPVIFNEIGNRSNADSAYEWIELRNVTNSRQNIREYRISMVTGVDNDKLLCEFDGDNWIEPNSVLLVLASDPLYDENHPISVGWNIDKVENDQVLGIKEHPNPPRYKVITFQNGGLPDTGEFVSVPRAARITLLRTTQRN